MELREIANDVWVCERPLKFLRVEIGTRMTVVKLGGHAWVCSPVEPNDALRRELDGLGEVRHVVAPNRYHHLFVEAFSKTYPAAQLYGSPGITRKRRDLQMQAIRETPNWGDEIACERLGGMPILDELAFLHRPSRTLLLTDLMMHFDPKFPRLTDWVMRLEGVRDEPGVPRTVRMLMIRDRTKLRTSIERILEWSFDRIVFAHGPIIEQRGHEIFERATRWLVN
ncbi:MAG TPA: DUF4336 domain-containing protein [Polyangiaceae bacterium]|jgi:uncharacterized protein DUF4336|nr:DUF4336 domain-containing protein [Polyangiaceae bacterium]